MVKRKTSKSKSLSKNKATAAHKKKVVTEKARRAAAIKKRKAARKIRDKKAVARRKAMKAADKAMSDEYYDRMFKQHGVGKKNSGFY